LIGALIAAVAAAACFTNISRVLLFWIAFVLTRPSVRRSAIFLRSRSQKAALACTVGSSAVLLAILVIGILMTLVKLRWQAALEPALVLEEANAEAEA